MISPEDKIIAISDAASGIGLATAHLLAARGATLTVSDVRSDALATATKVRSESNTSFKNPQPYCQRRRRNTWHDHHQALRQLDGAADLAGITGSWKKVEEEDNVLDGTRSSVSILKVYSTTPGRSCREGGAKLA